MVIENQVIQLSISAMADAIHNSKMIESIDENLKVISVDVKDLRWPTSLGGHGSDAMVS